MECIYDLMTFGIPSDILPITPTGELKFDAHEELVRRLRRRDDGCVKRIVLPGGLDVLLGRGKPLQKHPGNLRYHHFVESYQDEYETASKLEKTNLSKRIVQAMKESGGRFLKQDDAGWMEIDDDTARYKVSHTFRNHRIAARTIEKKKAASQGQRRKHGNEKALPQSFLAINDTVGEPKRRRVSDASRNSDTGSYSNVWGPTPQAL